jgi:hypothetical protein
MDYWTAQDWIRALDNYNYGAGWLGHNTWQLPVTPPHDCTCVIAEGASGNAFGPACTGSDLGYLYQNDLGNMYPGSVVPNFSDDYSHRPLLMEVPQGFPRRVADSAP